MSKIRHKSETLSLRQELLLSTVVCSLHPHKIAPQEYRKKSFILRRGWGAFLNLCKGGSVL